MLWLSNLLDSFLVPQLCTYLLFPTIPTYLLYHCNLVPWAVFIPICFLCLFPHKLYTMFQTVFHKYISNFFALSYCRTSESHQTVASYIQTSAGVGSVCAQTLFRTGSMFQNPLQTPFLIIILQGYLPQIFFSWLVWNWNPSEWSITADPFRNRENEKLPLLIAGKSGSSIDNGLQLPLVYFLIFD